MFDADDDNVDNDDDEDNVIAVDEWLDNGDDHLPSAVVASYDNNSGSAVVVDVVDVDADVVAAFGKLFVAFNFTASADDDSDDKRVVVVVVVFEGVGGFVLGVVGFVALVFDAEAAEGAGELEYWSANGGEVDGAVDAPVSCLDDVICDDDGSTTSRRIT